MCDSSAWLNDCKDMRASSLSGMSASGAAANALTVLRETREIGASVRLVSFDNTIEPLNSPSNSGFARISGRLRRAD